MMGFLERHRGPFRLCLTRPNQKKPGFFTTEWLKGESDHADVESEARALLDDPRDTITDIGVWSVRENQFVGTIKRERGAA